MARKMPTVTNDPKDRGRNRGKNIDLDPNMQNDIEKQKQEDSSDEDANWVNIRRILRAIPRNDPNDPFKPHSEEMIHKLAQLDTHKQRPLLPPEEEIMQYYGYDLDKCTIYDHPNPAVKEPSVPKESQYILNRLPAWLRCFIESKYNDIKKKYGERTHQFLKSLAVVLEYQKTKYTSLVGEPLGETEDVTEFIDFEDDYTFLGGEDDVFLEQEKRMQQKAGVKVELDPFRKSTETEDLKPEKARAERKSKDRGEEKEPRDLWSPFLLQKAGDSLRAALVAGASETEDEDYFEEGADEMIFRMERKKGAVRFRDEEYVYRGARWETVVAKESGFKEEAEAILKEEFMKPEDYQEMKKAEKIEELEKKKAADKAKKEIKTASKHDNPSHPLLMQSRERQRQAALWRERGVGRKASRYFLKNTCDGPIVEVQRTLHQTRKMQAMRAYANWIVASITFKYFIMIIIIGNATLLAFETGEQVDTYAFAFETLDSFFLSVYFVEFVLKFFAYPNQYFMSGFNVFDFVILCVSLIKSGSDWLDMESRYLAFLTIIRALRILRGVSLSIHIQVLVKALIDTLRNHVVSVVILLILLMYIISVVAFYLYGSVPGLNNRFGRFYNGMLELFAFVTMDGWTNISTSFAKVNRLHVGRIFCLILIVLGNFLFANIFIAIIIMQISDATDSFRKTRADERDIRVSEKQDEVFRRQKLDMRQLLARQRLGVSDDFYELGSRFVRRLRHDDLVDSHEIIFSPLWMDALYKSMQRIHHTSNIIMNQHRKMSDRLVRLSNLYDEDHLNIKGISRARYNRYYDLKSKFRLLKEQLLIMRNVQPKPPTRVKIDPHAASRVRSKSKLGETNEDKKPVSKKSKKLKKDPSEAKLAKESKTLLRPEEDEEKGKKLGTKKSRQVTQVPSETKTKKELKEKKSKPKVKESASQVQQPEETQKTKSKAKANQAPDPTMDSSKPVEKKGKKPIKKKKKADATDASDAQPEAQAQEPSPPVPEEEPETPKPKNKKAKANQTLDPSNVPEKEKRRIKVKKRRNPEENANATDDQTETPEKAPPPTPKGKKVRKKKGSAGTQDSEMNPEPPTETQAPTAEAPEAEGSDTKKKKKKKKKGEAPAPDDEFKIEPSNYHWSKKNLEDK